MRTNALPIPLRGYDFEHQANRLFSDIDRDVSDLPRRGDTLQLPFNDPNLDKEATTNGPEAQNEGQDIRKER